MMLNAVSLSIMGLGAYLLYQQMYPSSRLARANVRQQEPSGLTPQQIWVDKPVNTALRNDAVGNTPRAIHDYLDGVYEKEAAQHPGVRLVAHAAGV